ncbi:L-lysine 6-monooxygenase (NADPH-requiring)-domain-containing protein [Bisporella sp. PMI_857]|nr:L-lysine 6-monooxygenase (NADPH-requiring)-domain-containing protein [Bisporella sp. PMI_857]
MTPTANPSPDLQDFGQATCEAHLDPTNGHDENGSSSPQLSHVTSNDTLDLICVGFGPASLAIAIALHDRFNLTCNTRPRVLFLEKQHEFAWHSGMQLPGVKMQISFLKDLATPRDPTSEFTFLNYLFRKNRLNQFINLGTFLPSRAEYEDYLRWCASHFERQGMVHYGIDVRSVRVGEKGQDGKVASFIVSAFDHQGMLMTRKSRHVVIAIGGKPFMPNPLQDLSHIVHSSQSASTISRIQKLRPGRPLKFAVVGSGQSAAEVFNDLWDRFPDAHIKLIIKGASLRPSDDSPFVNEIFDPDRVDGVYNQDPSQREAALALDRGTNYGVVRLELLEHLYEKLYIQRLKNSDKRKWRCQILNNRSIKAAEETEDGRTLLILQHITGNQTQNGVEEALEVDYVFAATGYRRDAHVEMLADLQPLLQDEDQGEDKFPVAETIGSSLMKGGLGTTLASGYRGVLSLPMV